MVTPRALVLTETDHPAPQVPRLWPGATVVCIGSGPSLTREDVDACRGARIIAVNDAYTWAPFAAVLMASDAMWWKAHQGAMEFLGMKFALEPVPAAYRVIVLRDTGVAGIETHPAGLRTGRNSGAAAINLAVHFGAARIVLLGYDMQAKDEPRSHFFGAHPRPLRGYSNYREFRRWFDEMVEPLRALGVEVVNCSRETALDAFPRAPLADVLFSKERLMTDHTDPRPDPGRPGRPGDRPDRPHPEHPIEPPPTTEPPTTEPPKPAPHKG